MSAFFVEIQVNYLEKNAWPSQFSLWIPIVLAKIYFFRMVLIWGKNLTCNIQLRPSLIKGRKWGAVLPGEIYFPFFLFSITEGPSALCLRNLKMQGFKLKTHQMFSIHIKMQPSPVMLDLCLSKIQPKNHDYRDAIVIEMLSVHKRTKGWRFQIPPD